jgi:spore maturation protein CgeB
MDRNLKMIYVASLTTNPDRDSGWINSFKHLNWDVVHFSSHITTGSSIDAKIKKRLSFGEEYFSMKNNLINLVKKETPVWVHFRLPLEFDAKTIQIIKKLGCFVTEYFNDDPFSLKGPLGLYLKFRNALPYYDINFVYREHNIKAFLKYKAKEVFHCPPTFDLNRHYLQSNYPSEKYICDAAFIGHWEHDWRLKCMERLHESGFKILIKGGGWNNKINKSKISHLYPINHSFGTEYNDIYSSSIAGLCFFSKINRDSWTERALEIVAVGGVLVCERTDEAMTYFIDKQEAFFFSTIEELIEIVNFLKNNPYERRRVQKNAYNKLIESHNTIYDRSKFISDKIIAKLSN